MYGSWVRYLGLLGLLGVLGLVTGNSGFYGFCGFLGFMTYRGSTDAATFETNVNRSTRNSFIVTTLIFAATISMASLIGGDTARGHAGSRTEGGNMKAEVDASRFWRSYLIGA